MSGFLPLLVDHSPAFAGPLLISIADRWQVCATGVFPKRLDRLCDDHYNTVKIITSG
jgi:hypothetical protein